MDKHIDVEAKINNISTDKIKDEQRQELFECIRHFMKYLAFENISDELKPPEIAQDTRDHLIGLYEHHFEGRK